MASPDSAAPPDLNRSAARSHSRPRIAPVAAVLPDFPWDRLIEHKRRASEHPDGLVDLSVGTPVDPTPEPVQAALRAASNAPGYPTVWGTVELRQAIAAYARRRLGSVAFDDDSVLPTIGSKELVASLPAQLGIGPGRTVVIPEIAYPTYAVGALLSGAAYLTADSTLSAGPADVGLIWLNSPANPTGRVLPIEHQRKVVAWARERRAVVAADECYLEYVWEGEGCSLLDPRVNDGSLDSVLVVHSLSKRSNMAGFRGAFIVGDPEVVTALREVRRHSGAMVPASVQAAMTVALGDDAHVDEQRERYRRRRDLLRTALTSAGFAIEHSQGSLYLWATRYKPCMDTVGWLAERGILVAPGDFYGPAGARHVRVALTATDERIQSACARLS
jgi:succinyldiaminopimelate transaminase